ncbi:DUF418 domain-containing protein [Nocardiopsis metallicus]|uniref:DUF418 domain-containing protein n=1 Tax=Nocardiopsis metallicus TaxID=179819 RepID=A0A840WE77_9ACTN|nr:DUF418 domain-containing protein [Nocardiopsis metallicus]MBB5494434.1 uncharacterized protein [Nocardiopsis metallicus]
MQETTPHPPVPGADQSAEPPESAAVPVRRVAFLDVARALAMIGVVMMNAPIVVFAAERGGERPESTLTAAVDAALNLLMSGNARSMLMVLLGVGVVLSWRAAERRGGRPMVLTLWRYAVLGVVFGVPHLLVFSGDILTLYSVSALLLAPALPLLLGGSRARPFWAAVALFAAAPALEYLVGQGNELLFLVAMVPQTLAFFCLGVWLARRPELSPDFEGPTRLPVRMIWAGLLIKPLGFVLMFASDWLFPMEFDAEGIPVLGADGLPVVDPGSHALVSLGASLTGLGGALVYLGLVWWLVRRGRAASRVLGTLAPLGRMTLTVYLLSTAVFLCTKPLEGGITLLAQYGLAAAYFAVMVLAARWWMGAFRLGPLEWVWRSIVRLRPLPLRRRTAAGQGTAKAHTGIG